MSIASTVQWPREQRKGFTLFELLLAVFLLSLLFGAVVFSFSTLKSGAELNEGIDRLESMLRFARAHAAYHGCRVQVQFEPDSSLPLGPALYRLRLAWEAEPFENPGTFLPLPSTTWNIEQINEVIAVTQVLQPGEAELTPQLDPAAMEFDFMLLFDPIDDLFEEEAPAAPPLTFFPDGTSDSAQILLVSRSEDDPRRALIRLTGITGTFSHEFIAQPEEELVLDEEEPVSEAEDTTIESADDWLTESAESTDDWLSESTDAAAELDYDWISDVLDELEQADELEPLQTPMETEEANRIP